MVPASATIVREARPQVALADDRPDQRKTYGERLFSTNGVTPEASRRRGSPPRPQEDDVAAERMPVERRLEQRRVVEEPEREARERDQQRGAPRRAVCARRTVCAGCPLVVVHGAPADLI
jgi:hypothetical protein